MCARVSVCVWREREGGREEGREGGRGGGGREGEGGFQNSGLLKLRKISETP